MGRWPNHVFCSSQAACRLCRERSENGNERRQLLADRYNDGEPITCPNGWEIGEPVDNLPETPGPRNMTVRGREVFSPKERVNQTPESCAKYEKRLRVFEKKCCGGKTRDVTIILCKEWGEVDIRICRKCKQYVKEEDQQGG